MKLFVAAAVICLAAIFLTTVAGQTAGDELKHVILVAKQGTRPMNASALDVVKSVAYPSVVHLKGNAEIRASGFILHADQADYDEESGEIKASGNVSIKPYPPLNNK